MKKFKVDYKNKPNCLRKFRKESGYTQKQVSELIGIGNTSMISRWEQGRVLPNPPNIFRLAIVYRTMADALYIDLIHDLRREIQTRREKLEEKQKKAGETSGK
jgi:transcriptional regulator with XRE-family HTH domain